MNKIFNLDGVPIDRLGQAGQEVVGGEAASVVAHVDQQAVLAVPRLVQLLLEAVEARVQSSGA